MTSKPSKEGLKQVSSLNQKSKLLSLSLKYLKNQLGTSEELDLLIQLEENLERGNQELFDFLASEIKKENSDLGEHWADFIGDFCTFEADFVNPQGEQLEARLFLIPVILGVHTESPTQSEAQNDYFEIVKPGNVRELMVKAGLISDIDENITLLTDLLSLEDIITMPATRKYRALQFLISGDKEYSISRRDCAPPTQLRPHVLEIKFKFMVGCAKVRSEENLSPLSILLSPDDDALEQVTNEQLELSMKAMSQFTDELTKQLPDLLKKKEGVAIETVAISQVLEFTKYGIKSAFQEYEKFKRTLLLARAQELVFPKLKIHQSTPGLLDISLFEGEMLIEKIDINSMHASQEDMMTFLGEFFEHLESYGFYPEPNSLKANGSEELVFLKKRNSTESKSGKPSHLRLLH